VTKGASACLAVLLVLTSGAPARAADLTDRAAAAYDEYFARASREFSERASRATAGDGSRDEAALRAGRLVTQPGSGDGILDRPDSLVHHWHAEVFLPGTTVDRVLALSQAYDDYPRIFHPVTAASILAKTPDGFDVKFRMRESAGGLSATLDLRAHVRYVRVDAQRAYTISSSQEIREVENPGRPAERQLPEGRDSGYLWRAGTLTALVAAADGVFMTIETIGLSRPYPAMLGWLIEPIARRVGRHSVEDSAEEFRRAVLDRDKLPG
jgi:hypothetical protein